MSYDYWSKYMVRELRDRTAKLEVDCTIRKSAYHTWRKDCSVRVDDIDRQPYCQWNAEWRHKDDACAETRSHDRIAVLNPLVPLVHMEG